MKIAYLINSYPLPSQTFIRREIHALERKGWQIHRFAMRSNRASLSDPADLAEDGRTEHLLSNGIMALLAPALHFAASRPRQSFAAFRLAFSCGARGAGHQAAGGAGTGGRLRHMVYWIEALQLAARCHAERLPHIHAHFGTNSATVAMLAAEAGGLSWSFTAHGPEEFDAPRAFSLGEKCARAAFSLAISSYGRSQLCRWAEYPHWERLHVVHCGIEPWRFSDMPALPPCPPDGAPKLVAVGRLVEQKGFALLIEAMEIARKTAPDLSLTFVGDGPFRAALEAQVRRAGLSANITFAGWQDEAGVRAALAKAHALVLPSFAEGLPVVVMEAMAAGRPVIASAIAGLPELVTPENGWLVPAADRQALAQTILRFANTPRDQLARMGQAGRAAVFARHSIDTEAAKLAALMNPAR